MIKEYRKQVITINSMIIVSKGNQNTYIIKTIRIDLIGVIYSHQVVLNANCNLIIQAHVCIGNLHLDWGNI